MMNPEAITAIACEQLSKLAQYDFQIFAHALKTTFETMNVDLGLKGDQACLRYQDQLFDVGEMSFELIKETDDEDDEEVVDNEEDQVEEEDLEVEEEVVVPRPKRARKEVERYEATIRAPAQQKKEVAVAKKKNRDVVVANHIIAIREMPVVAQPSQEVGLPEQLTTNEMVEMFKLCEQAELNIKRRRYELALRMWREYTAANDQHQHKLTRKKYLNENTVVDVGLGYQILYLGEKLEGIFRFFGDENFLFSREFLLLSLDHVSKNLFTILNG